MIGGPVFGGRVVRRARGGRVGLALPSPPPSAWPTGSKPGAPAAGSRQELCLGAARAGHGGRVVGGASPGRLARMRIRPAGASRCSLPDGRRSARDRVAGRARGAGFVGVARAGSAARLTCGSGSGVRRVALAARRSAQASSFSSPGRSGLCRRPARAPDRASERGSARWAGRSGSAGSGGSDLPPPPCRALVLERLSPCGSGAAPGSVETSASVWPDRGRLPFERSSGSGAPVLLGLGSGDLARRAPREQHDGDGAEDSKRRQGAGCERPRSITQGVEGGHVVSLGSFRLPLERAFDTSLKRSSSPADRVDRHRFRLCPSARSRPAARVLSTGSTEAARGLCQAASVAGLARRSSPRARPRSRGRR